MEAEARTSGSETAPTTRLGGAGLWLGIALALCACGSPTLQDETARVLALEPERLRLGFRTDRPTSCEISLQGGPDATPRQAVTPTGTRHRAGFEGLSPGTTYDYRIACEGLAPFEHAVRTPADPEPALRIAVLGDSGKGSRGQNQLARAVEAAEPGIVLHTGDLLYEADERRVYVRPYAALLPDTPLFPAMGNHDVEFWDRFIGLFELPDNGPPRMTPGRSYWLDRGDVRVVVIDSNHGPKSLRYEIGPWLREVLMAEPAPRFKLLVMHHPPYTWGRHEPILPLQDEIVPLLEEAGVDLVLSGHDHNYQRTAPLLGGALAPAGERGIVYVVTGAGGGDLYEMERLPAQKPETLVAYHDDGYSFTQIDVTPDALLVEQVSAGGSVLDRFEIPARAAP
ncbi:MAG: metallophosphoesterase [Myxococcota bacterium]|nr:metallophosphoesterase [Myxococcota bacterium]